MVIRKSWWRVIAVFIILLTAAIMYWPLTTFADVGDGSGGEEVLLFRFIWIGHIPVMVRPISV